MKIHFFKTTKKQSYQLPTYSKVAGTDYNISQLSIWRGESAEITYIDDETFEERLKVIVKRGNLIEISKQEFDVQYDIFKNRLINIENL
jgi:hypothetical protein